MAEAFRCDRCGCYCDEEHAENNRPRSVVKYRLIDMDRSRWGSVNYIRLCPICSDELHEFMNNAPKERFHGVYEPPDKGDEND